MTTNSWKKEHYVKEFDRGRTVLSQMWSEMDEESRKELLRTVMRSANYVIVYRNA